MTTRIVVQALSLAMTVAGCLILPLVGIRALFPVLEKTAPSVSNYRGKRIAYGLGIVWLLWVAGAFAAGAAQNLLVEIVRSTTAESDPARWLLLLEAWPARSVAAVALVGCAFGFGLVDDLFGDRSDRGFKGHVGAMLRGRLTTGGLKLLGIGAASAFAAANIVNVSLADEVGAHPWGWGQGAAWAGGWVLATLVIALSANLINLTDLRPGRAFKSYSALAVVAVVVAQAGSAVGVFAAQGALLGQTVPHPWIEWLAGTLAMLVAVLGPVVAGWRLDLGERSMLGDAGANAAGALAGYMLASALTLPGLGVAALLLLLLNVASERVSFTAVIEGNAVLRMLDGLGRVGDGEGATEGDVTDGPGGTGS